MNYFSIAFLLVSLIDYITSSTNLCPIVAKCAYDNLEKSTCINRSSMSTSEVTYLDISRCYTNKTCSENEVRGTQTSVSCVDVKDKRKYYDTEKCYGNDTCHSRHCSSVGYCVGKPEGQTCENHDVCAIGLFCLQNQCTKLRGIGKPCGSDYDCVLGAGCSNQGTCFPYYSVATGLTSDDARFCKSNFTFIWNNVKYCAETRLTQDDCINSGKCYYDIINPYVPVQKGYQICQCSLAYPDKKFCPLDTSSSTWTKAIEVLNNTRFVHTSRRDTPNLSIDRKSILQGKYYPKFKDADVCVMDLYTGSSYLKASFLALALFLFL